MLNAMFYIAKTGSQWRYLPKEFPPWHRVYVQFLRWRDNGLIEQIYKFLHRKLRTSQGRKEDPSAGIIDSQSVKTTEKRGLQGMTQTRKSRGEKGIFL
jgi:putative transposase